MESSYPWRSVLITGASSGIGRALAEALAAPGVTLHLSGRDAARLATSLHAVREREAAGDSVEELLWLVWDRSGLAHTWRQDAFGAGAAAAEANRDLDAVVAASAERYAAFHARFCHLEDGQATARVVERLLTAPARPA